MNYLSRKFVVIVGVVFALLLLFLLGQIDSLVFQATNALFPGYGGIVCFFLIAFEVLGCFYLYRSFFSRPSRLVLKENPSDEDRRAFARELVSRLEQNPYVLEAGISREDPEFLAKALAHLDAIADKEIRDNGKKVFLGTALSQNGRLDALIVFFSLCRMVWRISKIYNQKPTPEEFASVVSTVSSSTFVAFSIEALDIPQMITDTMNELVPSVAPAVAANSVPFVGSCLHVFTQSLIDGAANCLLAVRAGIITRRTYSYAIYGGDEGLRRSCVREAARMMVEISSESVGYVAQALKKEIQELSVATGKKLVGQAVQGVKDTAHATVETVGKGTGMAVTAVEDGASCLADGASYIKDGVSSAAGQLTGFVVDSAKQTLQKVSDTRKLFQSNSKESHKDAPTESMKESIKESIKEVQKSPDMPAGPDAGGGAAADGTDASRDGRKQERPGAKKAEKSEKSIEAEKAAEKPDSRNPIVEAGSEAGPGSDAQASHEVSLPSQPGQAGASTSEQEKQGSVLGKTFGVAQKAYSAVSEGTSLIVGGVGSVAGDVASSLGESVHSAKKRVAGFFRKK